jgi:hypothetical protein
MPEFFSDLPSDVQEHIAEHLADDAECGLIPDSDGEV